MKHLLNNLTEEEKNSIRGQHTGGMNVVTENFLKLINTKSGNVRTYLGEQTVTTGRTVTTGQTVNTKQEYINEIKSLLDSMLNSNDYSADTVAQIIVNNTNYFLTRQKQWSDRTKYGEPLFNESEVKFLNKD